MRIRLISISKYQSWPNLEDAEGFATDKLSKTVSRPFGMALCFAQVRLSPTKRIERIPTRKQPAGDAEKTCVRRPPQARLTSSRCETLGPIPAGHSVADAVIEERHSDDVRRDPEVMCPMFSGCRSQPTQPPCSRSARAHALPPLKGRVVAVRALCVPEGFMAAAHHESPTVRIGLFR